MVASRKADQAFVRKRNASLVLNQLRLHAPLSRADLAKRIGLNRSTVSSIVSQLLEDAWIHETELQTDKIGRPGLSLELNPQGGGAIGVEIGIDYVHVILTDFVATIVWRRRVQLDEGETQETFILCAEEMIRQALSHASELDLRVLGVGLTVPGMVDVQAGELKFAPNLRWHDVPLRARLEDRFDVPVMVENDANASALGEYYLGSARDTSTFIYLGAGSGLGGGIIIDGHIFRGRGGFAGEIGHMTLDPDGELCSCGKRGCWETMVGPRAVVTKYQQRAESNGASILHNNGNAGVDFASVVEASNLGDLVAMAVLQDAATMLGIGIANLVNIFNPQLVILGGELSIVHESLIPTIKEAVIQNSLFPMRTSLSIVPSHHGTDDGVIGAIALVLDSLMRVPV